jgi:hypothetical protein
MSLEDLAQDGIEGDPPINDDTLGVFELSGVLILRKW